MSNNAQHTIGWYRQRIGRITGSRVGDLMKSSRKKDELFGETAMSYIYQVAAERMINPAILEDDEAFEQYLQQVDVTSKAMRWGTEQEAYARDLYEQLTGRHAVEVGSIKHPSIEGFASSPDGYYYDEYANEKGCLEIKCPTLKEYMRYRSCIYDNLSLLATKPEYYWQCMAHMDCNNAQWTDFIVYCPFLSNPIHIVRINRDETAIISMRNRIIKANEIIEELCK